MTGGRLIPAIPPAEMYPEPGAAQDVLQPIAYKGNPPTNLWEVEQQVCKLRDLLRYDPETGLLWNRHITDEKDMLATKVVGFGGRTRASFYKMWTTAANVVWLLHYGRWPKGRLRRRDGNPVNDRIENLYEAGEQGEVTRDYRHNRERVNKSRGVARCGPHHWQAYYRKDGQQFNLGRFKTEAEALSARQAWEAWERAEDLV